MQSHNWKEKLNFVYSTNPDFKEEPEVQPVCEKVAPSKQHLRVGLERKGRGGKVVTIISGFIGSIDDFKELAKTIKTKCGVGGTFKDDVIIIQGDFRDKIVTILQATGYNAKKSGG